VSRGLLPCINSQTKDGSLLLQVGLDTEFSSEGVNLIALAFDGGPKFIIHPYDWGFPFERTMRDVLGLDCLIFLLFNAGSDVHKLVDQFKIRIKRIRDLRWYCLYDDPLQQISLQALAARYLKVHVDESNRLSNFNVKPPLAKHLQDYGMIDADVLLPLDDAIPATLASSASSPIGKDPNLEEGTKVVVKVGGVEAAQAEVLFVGDSGVINCDTSRMWGDLYVGANQVLVRVEKVIVPAA
jgi:hypothetical protein